MAGGKSHKAQQARAVSADFVSSVTGPAPPGPVASTGAPAQLRAPPSSAFKQVEIQIVQLQMDCSKVLHHHEKLVLTIQKLAFQQM